MPQDAHALLDTRDALSAAYRFNHPITGGKPRRPLAVLYNSHSLFQLSSGQKVNAARLSRVDETRHATSWGEHQCRVGLTSCIHSQRNRGVSDDSS